MAIPKNAWRNLLINYGFWIGEELMSIAKNSLAVETACENTKEAAYFISNSMTKAAF